LFAAKKPFADLTNVLSLDSLAVWVRFLLADQDPSRFQAQEILRGQAGLMLFVVTSCHAKLEDGHLVGLHASFRALSSIGRCFVTHLCAPGLGALGSGAFVAPPTPAAGAVDKEKDKDKQVPTMGLLTTAALDFLASAHRHIAEQLPYKRAAFAIAVHPSLVEKDGSQNDEDVLRKHTALFQRLVDSCAKNSPREATAALSVVSQLQPTRPFVLDEKGHLWLRRLVEDLEVEDSNLAKALLANALAAPVRSGDAKPRDFVRQKKKKKKKKKLIFFLHIFI